MLGRYVALKEEREAMVEFLKANGASHVEVPEGGFTDSDADEFGPLDDDDDDDDDGEGEGEGEGEMGGTGEGIAGAGAGGPGVEEEEEKGEDMADGKELS